MAIRSAALEYFQCCCAIAPITINKSTLEAAGRNMKVSRGLEAKIGHIATSVPPSKYIIIDEVSKFC